MQTFSSLAGLEVTEKFVIRNIIFLGGGGVLIPFTPLEERVKYFLKIVLIEPTNFGFDSTKIRAEMAEIYNSKYC